MTTTPVRPEGAAFTDRQGLSSYWQDKDEVVARTIDWTRWLDGDTISTSTWTATGITIDSSANTTTSATVTLSAAAGVTDVVNTIVTAAGRTEQRTIRIYERVK